MEVSATQNNSARGTPEVSSHKLSAGPDFNRPVKPIGEFVTRDDFPQCTLGEYVDIGGHAGVVVEIVKNSIKVRSQEGTTHSFNFHTLAKLYAPVVHPAPMEMKVEEASTTTVSAQPRSRPRRDEEVPEPPAKKRVVIEEPNFDAPLKPMEELVQQANFPQCAFGQMVDVRGYTGVVVEIVNRSLKIRCREGMTRSYNADQLRKLFGKS